MQSNTWRKASFVDAYPFVAHINFNCLVVIYCSGLLIDVFIWNTVKMTFLANLDMICATYGEVF